MEQTLRVKVKIFFKSENKKKMMGIQGLYKTQKSWGGCHHLVLWLGAKSVTLLSTLRDQMQLRRRQCATRQQQPFYYGS